MNSTADRFTHPTLSADNSILTHSPFISRAETFVPSCKMKSFVPVLAGEFFILAEEERITAEFLFMMSLYLLLETENEITAKTQNSNPSQNPNCLLINLPEVIKIPKKKRN